MRIIHTINVKWPLQLSGTIYSRLATSRHLCHSDVIWCKMLFPDVVLSTRKQNTGEVMLQIP
jgi:hypothetical protein